jgi:hypothetical protein
MEYTSELASGLNENFLWKKAKITCFVVIFLALISSRTVNLAKIACLFNNDAKHFLAIKIIARKSRLHYIH